MVGGEGTRKVDYVLAAGPVLGLALALYVSTLQPDVGIWDTAEFQAIGPVLGTAHPTGYPSYTLLAWLASVVLQPFGNEAYRADLLSALLMAGAAALLAVRTVQATHRWPLGILAGVAFAVTPVAWRWGLRADPHALHVFAAALLLVLFGAWASRHERGAQHAGWWLVAASVVFGLSLGNHALTLLLAPGITVYVLMVAPRILWQRWRLVLACASALALAAMLVYLYLPLRSAMDPPLDYANPETWDAFWYVVLGEQFQGSLRSLPPLGDSVVAIWDELVRDLGLLSILAVAGAVLGFVRHPRLTILGLLWFACTWFFAIGYANANIERYYLVPLLVAGLWIALAADVSWDVLVETLRRPRRHRFVRATAGALVAVLFLLVLVPAVARYDDMDASGDTRGRKFVEAAFAALEPDAVVISWWSYSTPLWYGRWVEGRREDITIIDDRDIIDDGFGTVEDTIDRFLGVRPVYVIRHQRHMDVLAERYELERTEGVPVDLRRVLGPRETE